MRCHRQTILWDFFFWFLTHTINSVSQIGHLALTLSSASQLCLSALHCLSAPTLEERPSWENYLNILTIELHLGAPTGCFNTESDTSGQTLIFPMNHDQNLDSWKFSSVTLSVSPRKFSDSPRLWIRLETECLASRDVKTLWNPASAWDNWVSDCRLCGILESQTADCMGFFSLRLQTKRPTSPTLSSVRVRIYSTVQHSRYGSE